MMMIPAMIGIEKRSIAKIINREKIIEKLEKEVKRTYAIKNAIWERGENGYEKISEEITEHREPFVTLTIEMADKILALLKEQEWNRFTEDDNGLVCGLPGDDGTYLMTDGKDIWIDDYVDGVDDGVWLDSGRDIREIKAWMYMPELPK